MSTVFLILHWLVVAGLLVRVISRRPPVGVAVAWVAVIATTSFLGAGLYLLFGEKRLGRLRAERIKACMPEVNGWLSRLRGQAQCTSPKVDYLAQPLRHHAENLLGFPPLVGNKVELLDSFDQVFDALIADIDGAKTSCHLCFYIWHGGGRVVEIVDALVRAAGRGVDCRALADDIGSSQFLSGSLAQRLRSAGVDLVAALPTGPIRTLLVRRDLRNHRKIVVIDSQVAYTGSQNLVDPRFFKQEKGIGEWVDAIVRVEGPTASALDSVFALDWSLETGALHSPPADLVSCHVSANSSVVQVVPSGPDLRPKAIYQLILTAIYQARRELVMTTPYFVPDEAILTALLSAALRGVEVTLVVPARNDSVLVRYASVADFDSLASAGVKIFLYQGGLLHTKSMTVDGRLSIFGSVNLDMRSLWLNFEISLFIYDEPFTARLRALQQSYAESAVPLDLEDWRQRSPARRLAESAARLLSPLL